MSLLIFIFLAALLWDLNSQPGVKPVPLLLEAPSPNHGTTGKSPSLLCNVCPVFCCPPPQSLEVDFLSVCGGRKRPCLVRYEFLCVCGEGAVTEKAV